MTRKLKRALCLLLVLAAACAMLMMTAYAAQEQTTESAVQTRAAALATPVMTRFENTANGIKMTWGAVDGAAAYRVFVKTASGWKGLGNTTSTSYTYKTTASGTAYTFTVRCVSADGKSFTSGYRTSGWTWTYVAQPSVTGIENRVTGVKLTWDLVPGAERYRIYVKQPGGSWDYVGNTMGNTFTYIWVESGEDYIFTIRCANKDNNMLTSSFNTKGWQVTYIGQPQVTKMESVAEGVKLTWNSVPGAERYRVYLKNDSGWKEIGTTTDSSFVYTGAKDGQTYTFTVCCVNGANDTVTSSCFESGWHHSYKNPAPAEPEKLATPQITKLENTAGGIKVTWDAVDGAAQYRLFVKKGSGWKTIGTTTGTSLTYTGAESGETYLFTVRCVDAEGKTFSSDYNSDGWTQTYVAQPAVTKLENTATGIKVTWDSVPGAEGYRVYVKRNGRWACVGVTTGTGFVYRDVVSGTEYTFTVRCVNAANDTFTSGYNTAGWAVTYVAAPQITKLENVSGGVKVTWDSVPGAERYRVYVRLNGRWACVGVTTGTGFVYRGAVSGTEYTFTVRCVNAANDTFTSAYNTEGWTVTYIAAPQITGLESVSRGVKVTWDSVPGAEGYRVYVKRNGRWACVGVTTGTDFVYRDAVSGTEYTFTVRCVNAANDTFTSAYNTAGWSIEHE